MDVKTGIIIIPALEGAKNVRPLASSMKMRQDHAALNMTGCVHRKPLYRQLWPLVSSFSLFTFQSAYRRHTIN